MIAAGQDLHVFLDWLEERNVTIRWFDGVLEPLYMIQTATEADATLIAESEHKPFDMRVRCMSCSPIDRNANRFMCMLPRGHRENHSVPSLGLHWRGDNVYNDTRPHR